MALRKAENCRENIQVSQNNGILTEKVAELKVQENDRISSKPQGSVGSNNKAEDSIVNKNYVSSNPGEQSNSKKKKKKKDCIVS
jgi:hypothetical protein